MDGYRPCCVTRTFKYLSDARAVTASIEEVLAVSFDRYVSAHGAIIETGAQAALRSFFFAARGAFGLDEGAGLC